MNRKPLVLLALVGLFVFTACKDDKKPSDPPAEGAKTEPTAKPEATQDTKPASADEEADEPEAAEDSGDEPSGEEPSADDFD